MSLAIICQQKDPRVWEKAVQKALPNVKIVVNPTTPQPDVTFAVCWKPPMGSWELLPNLRVIQSLGAGVDHLFHSGPIPSHCSVTRVVDPLLAQDMFEYLLSHIMAHLQHHRSYTLHQREERWNPKPYRRISEVSISILGLGQIGSVVATKLADLGFVVRGWSRTKKVLRNTLTRVGADGLTWCLSNADVVINLLPLTRATHHLLNRESLKSCDNIHLINAGRAQHLVAADLLEGLNTGKVGSAVLDVFEEEPLPPGHPYWHHPAILVTPHVASLTNVDTAVAQIIQNYRHFKLGQPVHNLISRQLGY